MSRYSEIQIGDRAEISHEITQEDIARFVDLTGDDNKIHIDNSYASKTVFKRPVAHGMLSASFISTIIGTKIPGDGALWFSQSLEFLMPVRVGDVIKVIAQVRSKDDRSNSIELQTDIFNQNKEKIIQGTAKVKVIEQELTTVDLTEEVNERKVALVIGGTGGIGSATCLKLSKMGFDLAIHYNSNRIEAERLKQIILKEGNRAFLVTGDILSKADIGTMIQAISRRLGDVDVVINCATIKVPSIKLEHLEWDDLQKQLDINIRSNFELVQSVLPGMVKKNRGKFVFLTTEYTESAPPANFLPYVMAKSALNGFAKSLAVTLAKHDINVNLVSPGMTETNLISDIPEKARMLAAAKTPLRRLAKSSDVANAIGFLVSDDSGYLTGETIRVNGGKVML